MQMLGTISTADAFQKQMMERSRQDPTRTDAARLPFRIQMEVRGNSDAASRALAPIKWTASNASGD